MEKKERIEWKDVESAIDNLNKEDLKIWISDLLYLPEELDKAREEGKQEVIQSKAVRDCHSWKLVVEDIEGQEQICTECGIVRHIKGNRVVSVSNLN